MSYLIKATSEIMEGMYYGRLPHGSEHMAVPKRHAKRYPTPRDLPLQLRWGFRVAELSEYNEDNDPVGWYKCDGDTVAKVVWDDI
ncbi:MAG: hypothetical protein ACYTBJ_18810 [Planctomycetota bacterium]|jgi:hypothetical protein